MTNPARQTTGYEKIALTLSKHDDLHIFRRFATLNVQNLLYLQAELHALESKFQYQLDKDQNSQDEECKKYNRNWGTLDRVYQESKDKNTDENAQMRLILKIREKVKEYNKAMLLYAETCKLQKPQKRIWSVLYGILYEDTKTSDRLTSLERDIWTEQSLRNDFISLHPTLPRDLVTRMLLRTLLKPYHHLIGKRFKTPDDPEKPESSAYEYNESHLQYPVFVLTMMLSSLLPVVAIVILYTVDNMAERFGALAGFTAGFSLLLSLIIPDRLTKRVEIFAAAATFSAVQVVFIASNQSNQCCTK